jgi:hypothetical protein
LSKKELADGLSEELGTLQMDIVSTTWSDAEATALDPL